ncbi:MAG: hypothetical protein A4E32_01800 [Methanomassiliicoccales archaeon PtaU1.Bin124]|nr:MAG: hypothetical protein A4E32_01800 [Methanomassiliicoccales archaeon PtaU1.Bin124]
MRCRNCGKDNSPSSKYCVHCGGKVEGQPDPIPPYQRKVPPPYTRDDSNRTLVIALVVLLAAAMVVIVVAAIGNQPTGGGGNIFSQYSVTIDINGIANANYYNPEVKLSIDQNGDGTYDIVRYYLVESLFNGTAYTQIEAITDSFDLSGNDVLFHYRVEIFYGSTTLYYVSDQASVTHTGMIRDGDSGSWAYDLNHAGDWCHMTTSYVVHGS